MLNGCRQRPEAPQDHVWLAGHDHNPMPVNDEAEITMMNNGCLAPGKGTFNDCRPDDLPGLVPHRNTGVIPDFLGGDSQGPVSAEGALNSLLKVGPKGV